MYDEDTAIESMDLVEVTLSICTLFNGVPHGLAIIRYTDPDYKFLSFTGVGMFNNGRLHNTSFTCAAEFGGGVSLSKMRNGRPANDSFFTYFL